MDTINMKKVLWEKFLEDEDLMDGLESRVIEDEQQTVIYRGGAETNLGIVPMFIILDTTDVATIRFVVARDVMTDKNKEALIAFANRENADVPLVKFYLEEADGSLYLDFHYISNADHFEASTLFVLLRQLLEYLKDVTDKINKAILGQMPEQKEREELQ